MARSTNIDKVTNLYTIIYYSKKNEIILQRKKGKDGVKKKL